MSGSRSAGPLPAFPESFTGDEYIVDVSGHRVGHDQLGGGQVPFLDGEGEVANAFGEPARGQQVTRTHAVLRGHVEPVQQLVPDHGVERARRQHIDPALIQVRPHDAVLGRAAAPVDPRIADGNDRPARRR